MKPGRPGPLPRGAIWDLQFPAPEAVLLAEGCGTLMPPSLARPDDVTGPARPLGYVVVLPAQSRLGRRDWRTTFPSSLCGGAPGAARGRDWLLSRPHAGEPKEQLCCDRGRAARPSELREGALRGGRRPAMGREDEARGKERGCGGWRRLPARRKGRGGEAGGWGLGLVPGVASVETLGELTSGRTAASREEAGPHS